jgi:hypothetical protein
MMPLTPLTKKYLTGYRALRGLLKVAVPNWIGGFLNIIYLLTNYKGLMS